MLLRPRRPLKLGLNTLAISEAQMNEQNFAEDDGFVQAEALINWGLSMLRNLFFILTLAVAGLSSAVQAQNALPAGPSAFVRLPDCMHCLIKQIKWWRCLPPSTKKWRLGSPVCCCIPSIRIRPTLRALSGPRSMETARLIFHLNNADLGAYLEEVPTTLGCLYR